MQWWHGTHITLVTVSAGDVTLAHTVTGLLVAASVTLSALSVASTGWKYRENNYIINCVPNQGK